MKKITLTNATIIPFYKKNASDPDEIIRIITPKDNSNLNSTIVSFNVETKMYDKSDNKARIFEQCTIFAKNDSQVSNAKNIVELGAVVEIKGYERQTKNEKTGKYYSNIIVESIIPISSGVPQDENPTNTSNVDDLPF